MTLSDSYTDEYDFNHEIKILMSVEISNSAPHFPLLTF